MLDNNELVEKGKQLFSEIAHVLEELPDEQIYHLFENGEIEGFLKALLDPQTVSEHASVAEFFLANKHRAWFVSALRALITRAYSIKVTTKSGISAYVSPCHFQSEEEGVLLLEGKDRFTGAFAMYKDGEAKYAIAARDVKSGDDMGIEDFNFISITEYNSIREAGLLPTDTGLDAPVERLKRLLVFRVTAEAEYQQLLADYPWMLGMQYRSFDRHTILDDDNIPDFTAIRTGGDGIRDVFELKSPFLPLTRRNGTWNTNFHDSWQQAESRIDFIERNIDYLYREKGLIFDNPRCHLILGYKLEKETINKLRAKARQHPKIIVSTYDNLVENATSTVATIRRLQKDMEEQQD